MIAVIRTRVNGKSKKLCDLDLMKFTENQVRQRMYERGIEEDAFFICSITDWNVDRILSLREAYVLKQAVEELYDGDSTIVAYLLNQGRSIYFIATHYYKYLSKDEVEAMVKVIGQVESEKLLVTFYKTGSWVNFVSQYLKAGYLLQIKDKYYIDVS